MNKLYEDSNDKIVVRNLCYSRVHCVTQAAYRNQEIRKFPSKIYHV